MSVALVSHKEAHRCDVCAIFPKVNFLHGTGTEQMQAYFYGTTSCARQGGPQLLLSGRSLSCWLIGLTAQAAGGSNLLPPKRSEPVGNSHNTSLTAGFHKISGSKSVFDVETRKIRVLKNKSV